ncbi:phytanoyl-CoA dioxygenase family protein [Streptomyces sp. ISL-66]|uniref:phytanoyl-CoA dioxygenase family protein n=1 Tax=Streptomyces sp. ISL-66 TaxID=2819186 RepID=UPI001BE760D5|nr:phytanoyl-CoA dioxygenase family protein [Streptomyces sp. ISL-66]MBT2470892.1 phytanoyl-CoA dioxygenase family protein [Streptomyces sp. ISL-66]
MRDFSKVAEEYSENGFAIIRDVIPVDLIDEARSHIEWLMEKYPDVRPEHLHHPLIRNDAFWVRLISDPRLTDIAEFFLGPDVACFTAHYICKPAFDGQPVLWHQDGAYWKLEPMQALTVWLAVDRSSTENGCLRMVPGSHRLPLHTPKLRTDTPNMLSSVSDEDIVNEWVQKAGIVDIELNPGDVSIHHPHLLHCSEANTSPMRRAGLDIGYISTSTRISSDGLYLDPILVRGEPVENVNNYRPLPRYTDGETIPFAGHEEWNDKIKALGYDGAADASAIGETPLETTYRMIERLQEGSVAR